MADEPQTTSTTVLRGINWRETFPFTNIFRAFRIAVHPSKLVLGLLALLTLYVGGRVLDGVWPNKHLALFEEVETYATLKPGDNAADKLAAERSAAESRYAGLLTQYRVELTDADAKAVAATFDKQNVLKASIMGERQKLLDDLAKERDKRLAEAGKETDATKQAEAKKKVEDEYKTYVAKLEKRADDDMASLRQIVPHGPFDVFFTYEVRQVNGVVQAVLANEWVSTGGVKDRVVNFLAVGPRWLWGVHPVYAVLFTVLFLLVWAVFGGAISRIAAVQVARDEKISVRQALRFSVSKVLSFVFAPVIPLVIVVVLGLLIAAGGLLFYIPVFGPIVAGAFFFLALIAGVVITLVLFGTVGGLNLMFPTVAVEGSDSFDAISRSFSYVFARPWRMLFYTAVAVAYGALSYLFVRLFVYVTLAVTHLFLTWFLYGQPGQYIDRIWPAPNDFWKIPYDINFAGLAWSEAVSAFLIAAWVYLLLGLAGAFVISFYFSANTIIYYLMRREVDATELEDVYVEEAEDDLVDPAPLAAPSPVAASTAAAPVAVAEPTSPATIVGTTADLQVPPTTPPPDASPSTEPNPT
jgi:hypothetical protein